MTDRYISFWEAANRPRTVDYPFTLIEIRIGPDGKGEGKMSIATKVTYDKEQHDCPRRFQVAAGDPQPGQEGELSVRDVWGEEQLSRGNIPRPTARVAQSLRLDQITFAPSGFSSARASVGEHAGRAEKMWERVSTESPKSSRLMPNAGPREVCSSGLPARLSHICHTRHDRCGRELSLRGI